MIAPDISNIYLQVEIDRHLLLRQINVLLKNKIFDIPLSSSRHLRIQKIGSAAIDFEDNKVLWEAPLSINMHSAGYRFNTKMQGAIRIKFRSQIKIKPDWHLHTSTALLSFQWIENPTLKIGRVAVPLSSVKNLLIKLLKNKLSKAIDKTIAKRLDLYAEMKKLWTIALQPHPIFPAANLQLMLHPERLGLSELIAQNNCMTTQVHFSLAPQLQFEPHAVATSPLPENHKPKSTNKRSEVLIGSQLTYRQVGRMLTQILADKPIQIRDKNIFTNNIQIKKVGAGVNIHATLSGAVRGEAKFYMEIQLSPQGIFNLEISDWKLSTGNVLIRGTSKVFSKIIKQKIRRKLEELLNNSIQKTEALLREKTEAQVIQNYFVLDGEAISLLPQSVALEQHFLKFTLLVRGRIRLRLRAAHSSSSTS